MAAPLHCPHCNAEMTESVVDTLACSGCAHRFTEEELSAFFQAETLRRVETIQKHSAEVAQTFSFLFMGLFIRLNRRGLFPFDEAFLLIEMARSSVRGVYGSDSLSVATLDQLESNLQRIASGQLDPPN
jgi:hypothetical protein